jgi:hypothetical protein
MTHRMTALVVLLVLAVAVVPAAVSHLQPIPAVLVNMTFRLNST